MENMTKTALVTGASKGIGCALVEELISKGWLYFRHVGYSRTHFPIQQEALLFLAKTTYQIAQCRV